MFWSRPLLVAEQAFVHRFFGASLDALLPRMRLYLRRLGDTRRALSMNGGRLYLPRQFFEESNPARPLLLTHPLVAGIFAHELLHQWQRLQGRKVTREALRLQLHAICLKSDPYAYTCGGDEQAMLEVFLQASVEQQGQIWQDHVSAVIAGRPLARMQAVQRHVCAETVS